MKSASWSAESSGAEVDGMFGMMRAHLGRMARLQLQEVQTILNTRQRIGRDGKRMFGGWCLTF